MSSIEHVGHVYRNLAIIRNVFTVGRLNNMIVLHEQAGLDQEGAHCNAHTESGKSVEIVINDSRKKWLKIAIECERI